MGVTNRTYSAASFALELEGTVAGFLRTVEGGEPWGQVIREAADTSGIVKKHVGKVQYQPIVLTFGAGMASGVYQWISEMLSGKASAKNGAIVFSDYNFKETSRLEFDNAVITEISFPAVDGESKDLASFTLTLQPQVTRTTTASAGKAAKGFGTQKVTKWNVANFVFKVAGLEKASSRVNAIDAIVIQQGVIQPSADTPARDNRPDLDIQDIRFSVAENDGKDFLDWANDFLVKGNNDQSGERSGSLEYRDPAMKMTLFTLTFSNLGITKAYRLRSQEGAAVKARIGVELYCEQMSFGVDQGAMGSPTPSTSGASPSAAGSNDGSLTNTLIGIVAGRITAEEALRVAVRSTNVGMPAGKVMPEIVAKRLMLTFRPPAPGPVAPRREEGITLGETWAADAATIDELRQVALLDQAGWSALNLNSGHSLVDVLRAQGLIPDGIDGPLQLERDAFVEGIVAGATGVLNTATPHLTSPTG